MRFDVGICYVQAVCQWHEVSHVGVSGRRLTAGYMSFQMFFAGEGFPAIGTVDHVDRKFCLSLGLEV